MLYYGYKFQQEKNIWASFAQISTTSSCSTVPESPVKVLTDKVHRAGVMSWLREADIHFIFSSGFDFDNLSFWMNGESHHLPRAFQGPGSFPVEYIAWGKKSKG